MDGLDRDDPVQVAVPRLVDDSHRALPDDLEPLVPLRHPGRNARAHGGLGRSEEHTSELQSLRHLVCRLLLEKKKQKKKQQTQRKIEEKKQKTLAHRTSG